MPYLTTLEVIKAFQDGKRLQYNSKRNEGSEYGWMTFEGAADALLASLANERLDFRVAPRFKVGDFALLRSLGEVPRYADAFRKIPKALYVRVLHDYYDGTYTVTNGDIEQIVRDDDLITVEV